MSKKKVSYISASQFVQWVDCNLFYKYIYVDDLPVRNPGNVYTAYGSAFHKALEVNYRQKIKSKKDLKPKELLSVFNTEYSKQLETAVIARWEKPEVLRLQGENAVYRYMEEVAPKYQPIAVEKKFEITMKNYPITIYGIIDLITDDGIIIDHKTVGKKPTWTEKKAGSSVAMTLYSTAYRKMYDKAEKHVQFDLLPREETQDYTFLKSTRTNKDVITLLEAFSTMDRMVKEDIWIPNLNNCHNCPLKDNCNQSSFDPKLFL